MSRVDNLVKELRARNIDAVLLMNKANVRYVSGFTAGESFVIVSDKARVFITDSRYTEQAQKECVGFEVIKWRSKGNDFCEVVSDVCERFNIKKLGFEQDVVTVSKYNEMKEGIKNAELVGTSGIVAEIRRVKDESEIENLKKAAAIMDEVIGEIVDYIKPGVTTEKDVEREIQYRVRLKGGEDIGFSSIVASGKNSSLPHAIPTTKVIENGDFLTLDVGAKFNGYRSDMTRTFVVGNASDEQKRIYNAVLKCQLAGIEAVKAGVCGNVPDAVAKKVLVDEGVDHIYEHGLGHGIGLDIHERPSVSARSNDILMENEVVTVEPGVYVPGWGGLRIEDSVVVKKDGCEIITKFPKELIEIK